MKTEKTAFGRIQWFLNEEKIDLEKKQYKVKGPGNEQLVRIISGTEDAEGILRKIAANHRSIK